MTNVYSRITKKIRHTAALMRLGSDARSKRTLCLKSFMIPLNNRMGRSNHPYTVSVRKFDRTTVLHLLGTYDELLLLDEILVNEAYNVPHVADPRTIVDLGSNIGLSVVFYALKYPAATIHAFEPHPDTYALLVKNIAGLGNVHPHQMAVTHYDGNLPLFVDPHKNIASSVFERRPQQKKIMVPCKTMDSIVREYAIDAIDILKFDIEGAEKVMFKAFGKLSIVNHCIGELHLDLIGMTLEEFMPLVSHFDLVVDAANKSGRYIIRGTKKSV